MANKWLKRSATPEHISEIVKERTGMRKDRVSSCMYGYAVCQILSAKNKPKNNNTNDLVSRLPIRQGKRFSMFN